MSQAIREVLELIQADCEADANRPLIVHLSTPTVGELRYAQSERNAEMLAMISALATQMLKVLDEIEKTALHHEQAMHP